MHPTYPMRTIRGERGFTLLELLICLAVFCIASALVWVLGFGVALAFSLKVLIPWLGIPAAYSHGAALVAAWVLSGAGVAVVMFVLFILAGTVGLIGSRRRR